MYLYTNHLSLFIFCFAVAPSQPAMTPERVQVGETTDDVTQDDFQHCESACSLSFLCCYNM